LAILEVQDLSIDYRTRRGDAHAVRSVSFGVEPGETVAVIGESGSGKTTLATGLIRLVPKNARFASGRVLFTRDGMTEDILEMDPEDLRRWRWRDCAMVFQSALNAFNPVITIWDHFVDTARAHGIGRHVLRGQAVELLELVRLEPRRVLPAYAHELSGGMRQRVLIAMSLLLRPGLVIFDEPTTALDILTQRSIIDLLRELRRELGFAMIFISHDLSLAAELADRMLTMYAGRVVERARVADLFYRPRHPYTLGLLQAMPRVTGAIGELGAIPGSPPDLVRLPAGCTYHPRCPFMVEACKAEDPPLLAVDTPAHDAACIRWQAVADHVGRARA
jgi:peptide/nickel transport system ATP-binding protein